MAEPAIHRAIASGRLHEVHHGVYSTILPSLMQLNARYAAAILKGGKGARLYGLTTAWLTGLRKQRPPVIHVAITGKRTKIEGIRWHRPDLAGEKPRKHEGLPVTPLVRLPLKCAADLSTWDLKGLLAELEYHHDIGPEAVVLRRGAPGSAKLRRAVEDHTPQLAETRSELERAFIRFLKARGLTLPLVNHPIATTTIDAAFEDQRLIVELDGVKGHQGDRRLLRDHRRDLHRRRDGYAVLRYAYAQLFEDGDLIEAELRRYGVR